jgi:hypothetical protein
MSGSAAAQCGKPMAFREIRSFNFRGYASLISLPDAPGAQPLIFSLAER